MKVRIEKKAGFYHQLIFDLATEKFEFYTLSGENDPIIELPFKGFYDIIDGQVIILYKKEKEVLVLKVDNLLFSIRDDFSVDYHVNGDKGILILKDKHKEASLKICLNKLKPVSTLWYTEEEEDVNFGLWIFNVLSSQERIKNLLDNW